MKILIINGPNLQATGQREPEIYGTDSFDNFIPELQAAYEGELEALEYFQTNHEGAIIDALYEAQKAGYNAIILNAGALTHTSIAIGDAIRAIDTPVIEVHMSQTSAREDYRHNSFIAAHAVGSITGFGMGSYSLAVLAAIEIAAARIDN